MPEVMRLNPDQLDVLLEALDYYALLEDVGRSKEHDEQIADLALLLIGNGREDIIVREILVLFDEPSTGHVQVTDDSNTALDDTIDGPVMQSEEDRDGEEVDDEADLDDEEDDEEEDEDEDIVIPAYSVLDAVLVRSTTAPESSGELTLEA